MMKGGRISRYIQPARAIHILSIEPGDYNQLMHNNLWLHTLPDCTTFELAINNLKREDAWDAVPASVRRHLLKADPRDETVKADEFEKWDFRIFGVMPGTMQTAKLGPAMEKARELGFKPYMLAHRIMGVEAGQAGMYMACIARSIEESGQPFEPPCALFSSGEFIVTVGKETGVGGRHQEYALTAATRIAGSENIVIGSVDTDGTDGPGTQFAKGLEHIPCLAGGLTDGTTMGEAQRRGVNVEEELKRHNTTPALWKLDSGVVASPNIRVDDLTVMLVLARTGKVDTSSPMR
jgi:glycerate-2-kinase